MWGKIFMAKAMSPRTAATALRRQLAAADMNVDVSPLGPKNGGPGLKLHFRETKCEVRLGLDADQWRLRSVTNPSCLPKGEASATLIRALEEVGVADLEPLRPYQHVEREPLRVVEAPAADQTTLRGLHDHGRAATRAERLRQRGPGLV